jgi:tetratricopeptide (TPR) repeat protein
MKSIRSVGALVLALSLGNGAAAQSFDRTEGSGSRLREQTGERTEGLLGRSRSETIEDGDLTDEGARRTRSRAQRADRIPQGRCTISVPLSRLSAQAAVRLGWCLMDADRPMQAVPAFTHAVEFGDAAIRQEAAYGKTLALLRKTVTDQAGVAATDAPQSRQRNAEVGANILEQRALAAFREERYVETILHLEERERLAPMQTDLLALKGYAYLRTGHPEDATRIFRALERAGIPEGAEGVNAVNAALGLVRAE